MKLRINQNKVRVQVISLKKNIDEINAQINELKRIQSELPTAWKGEAANTFNQKVSELIGNLEFSKKEMVDLVEGIERIANRIQQEDQRNMELANNLSVQG